MQYKRKYGLDLSLFMKNAVATAAAAANGVKGVKAGRAQMVRVGVILGLLRRCVNVFDVFNVK